MMNSIIANAPVSATTAEIMLLRLLVTALANMSTSVVRRLKVSPFCRTSKYASGILSIFLFRSVRMSLLMS